MSQPIRLGAKVPVSLQLADRDATKYPRCLIYDSDDNLLTTLDLSHDANGRYVPASNYTMPDEDFLVGQYVVYSDSGHTTIDKKYETTDDAWSRAYDQDDTEAALTTQGYTTARAAYLDELAAANLPADVDAILLDTSTTIPTTITALQSDTDDIQLRLPAALVGGRMDADVGAMQAGTVTAAVVATDAIDADALAADAVTAIQSGIATSAELTALEAHGDATWATAVVAGLATSAELAALETHGDGAWATADLTGIATATNVTDARDAVIVEVDANETKIDALATTGGAGPWTTASVAGLATSAELAALETHGDATWATAVGFATPADLSGLATSAELDALETHGDATWATAVVGALATSAELAALQTHGDGAWATANVSALATSAELTALEAHGDTTWATATGFAVPGDAMTLTAGELTALVAAIAADLSATHGAGDWEGAGLTPTQDGRIRYVWKQLGGDPTNPTTHTRAVIGTPGAITTPDAEVDVTVTQVDDDTATFSQA